MDAKDAKETTIEEVRVFDSKQRVKQQYPPYQKISFLLRVLSVLQGELRSKTRCPGARG